MAEYDERSRKPGGATRFDHDAPSYAGTRGKPGGRTLVDSAWPFRGATLPMLGHLDAFGRAGSLDDHAAADAGAERAPDADGADAAAPAYELAGPALPWEMDAESSAAFGIEGTSDGGEHEQPAHAGEAGVEPAAGTLAEPAAAAPATTHAPAPAPKLTLRALREARRERASTAATPGAAPGQVAPEPAGGPAPRPVPPVAGEVEIEPQVQARSLSGDDLLAFAAGLGKGDRGKLKDRLKGGTPDRADRFARDLVNALAGVRVLGKFLKVLDDPRHFDRAAYDHARAARVAANGERGDESAAPATGAALVEQARAGERAGGGAPLPADVGASVGGEMGADLSTVRVHADTGAADVAASESAHAVTVGEDIFMGAGAHRPDSPEGQALLAHEATHAVQQRATGPEVQRASIGEAAARGAAERSADQIAARHLADARGTDVNARTYVQLNRDAILGELRVLLDTRELAPGHPGLVWTDLARFKAFVVHRLNVAGADTFAEKLRGAMAPVDLWSVVDQHRILTKVDLLSGSQLGHDMAARLDAARDPQRTGPVGPTRYVPAVGTAIASAIETNLLASLARMGPRYFDAARRLQRDAAARGVEAPAVAQSHLIPSHPLDWVVAGSLCEPGVVEPAEGTADLAPDAPDPNRNRRLTFEWQGARGLWNYVKVTTPADPTPEEVARNVLGRHDLAYRLIIAPPLFGVPEDLAERIDAAREHRPAALGDRPAGTSAPTEHDPLVALGTSAAGDEAALAAAGRAIEARDAARREAGAPDVERDGEPRAAADRGALMEAVGQSQLQLQAIASIVAPFGLGDHVEPARAWLAAKRAELATVPEDAVRLWAEVLRGQQHVLVAASADLSRLAKQLQDGAKDDPWGGTTQLPPAQRETFVAYLRAVAVAHIPDAGLAALADARARQRNGIPAMLEGLLAQAVGKVEQLRYLGGQVEGEAKASREIFGLNIRQRHQELMRRVADLRLRMQTGQVEAAEVERLHGECDALVFEAEVVANLGSVRQVYEIIEKLMDSGWVVAAGQVSDLEPHRVAAHHFKSWLASIHHKWIALQQRAAALSAQLERERVPEEQAAQMARQLVSEGMEDIKARLARLASDAEIRAFLQKAYDEIEDAQQKAMILQICVMVGITIVSSAAGGVAGSAANTALRGVQGGRLIAGLSQVVVESATMSGLQAAITGDSFIEAMTVDFTQNLLTLGALAAWDDILDGTRIGMTLARTEQAGAQAARTGAAVAGEVAETGADVARASRAAYVGAKGVQLTGNVLIIGGTQMAGMQAEAAIREGRALTMQEVVAEGAKGIGMMIGTGVLTRLAHRPLNKMNAWAASRADLAARRGQVEKLAGKVAETGDPTLALELLRQDRALLEAELAEYQRLSKEPPEHLRRMGLSPEMVEAYQSGAAQHLAQVDAMTAGHVAATLGLDVVVPGHTYSGPQHKVAAVVAEHEARGYRVDVDKLPEGNQRYRLASEDGATRLEIVTTIEPPGTGRIVLAGEDARLREIAPRIEPLPGTLDVMLHGNVDDFEVVIGGRAVHIDHRRLARWIEKSGAEFERIRLLSCETGKHAKGAAQHLANKLGVEVIAPSDTLHVFEDGRMVIGPDESRNTGRWVTYKPQPSELRSKPYRPEAANEATRTHAEADRTSQGKTEDGPTAHRASPEAASATALATTGSRADDARTARRAEVATELARIPVTASSEDGRVTYEVSRADGSRMLALFAELDDVRVREYARGFTVHHDGKDWFFAWAREGAAARAQAVASAPEGGIGLPPANAGIVEFHGFRGLQTVNGVPWKQLPPQQRAFIEHMFAQMPLLKYGHVGISFDGGATIHGFTPPARGTVTLTPDEVSQKVFNHEPVPGVVGDDTRVFEQAARLAREQGWDTEITIAALRVDPPAKEASHGETMDLAKSTGKHDKKYQFPYREADENGRYFADENTRNCATFPQLVGLCVPETSGRLSEYMPELRRWAAESPIDPGDAR